jgi:hypothetical protein
MFKKIMIIGAIVAAATVESSAQFCSTCALSANALTSNALIMPVIGAGHFNLNGREVGIKF